jgi:S-adenosylmethionine-diacylgycerolhomoserine-N-methlytransferase
VANPLLRHLPPQHLLEILCALAILSHMLLSPIRDPSHAEGLESFYQGQATGYDAFRSRLLRGRQDLWKALSVPDGGDDSIGGGYGLESHLLGGSD